MLPPLPEPFPAFPPPPPAAAAPPPPDPAPPPAPPVPFPPPLPFILVEGARGEGRVEDAAADDADEAAGMIRKVLVGYVEVIAAAD